MKRFEIKEYKFGELAQLYFPGAPRSSALRLLHKYITSAHGLLPALEKVGYQRASRRLTRRQVQLIFEYLGEPWYELRVKREKWRVGLRDVRTIPSSLFPLHS